MVSWVCSAARGWRTSQKAMMAVLTVGASLIAVAASASSALAWTPGPARYGVGLEKNRTVAGAGGTLLSADVYYPTDLKTGKEAAGAFPVLIEQTPYGKGDQSDPASEDVSQTPLYPDLVERGYISVVVDVRGSGGSEGEWGLFDPIQGVDGADVARWAAKLPHSDGKVGLIGASYMGIDQLATAADAGPHSPIKAIFPAFTADDVYRDTAFAGGFTDLEFDAFYLGLTSTLNIVNPLEEGSDHDVQALADHVHDLDSFDAALLASVESGGQDAYDESYWSARAPERYIQKIVDYHIPALMIGGWFDLFQRGEPLNYAAFQNAYDHRPLLAAMTPHQRVTSRYQLIQGPYYHSTADGVGFEYDGLSMNDVALAWFDHWLKGIDTGITDTTTPLHLADITSGRFYGVSRYPLNQTTPTTYYLGGGGTLTPSKPSANSSPDKLVFTGSEIPCSRSVEQWLFGLPTEVLADFKLKDPCTSNSTPSQIGPGTQNYTTKPFTSATTLGGPIGAALYASATTTDTEWVVTLSDVAPNGSSVPITSGLLEGDQRAVDKAMSWYAPDGQPLLPYHPYTKAAQTPVSPGQVTRYEIEVYPTFYTFQPGHRLRVTIATSDFPHALATAVQLPHLIGGVYELQHSSTYPSSVELPLAPLTKFTPMPSSPLGCPAATGSLRESRIGPLKLGMTRAQARRALIDSSVERRTAYKDFFCLTPIGIRDGYLSPALAHTLSGSTRAGLRRRVIWISTSNTHYKLHGVTAGTKLTTVARKLSVGRPFKVGRNTWYVFPTGSVQGIIKVRKGVIEEIGIADRALTTTRGMTSRFLRSFD